MARVCPGTPFRTRWLNETFYLLSCLMNMKEGTYMRWSHTRHHTETVMVGMDPEIQVMAACEPQPSPPRLPLVLGELYED